MPKISSSISIRSAAATAVSRSRAFLKSSRLRSAMHTVLLTAPAIVGLPIIATAPPSDGFDDMDLAFFSRRHSTVSPPILQTTIDSLSKQQLSIPLTKQLRAVAQKTWLSRLRSRPSVDSDQLIKFIHSEATLTDAQVRELVPCLDASQRTLFHRKLCLAMTLDTQLRMSGLTPSMQMLRQQDWNELAIHVANLSQEDQDQVLPFVELYSPEVMAHWFKEQVAKQIAEPGSALDWPQRRANQEMHEYLVNMGILFETLQINHLRTHWRATLTQDQVIQGYPFQKSQAVIFDSQGKVNLERSDPYEPAEEIESVVSLVKWRPRQRGESTKDYLRSMGFLFSSFKTHSTTGEILAILSEDHEISSMHCKKGTSVRFYPNGKLRAVKLNEPAEIQGIKLAGGIWLHQNGNLLGGTLLETQEIEGTEFSAGSLVQLDTEGKLVKVKLAAPQTIGEQEYDTEDVVFFDEGDEPAVLLDQTAMTVEILRADDVALTVSDRGIGAAVPEQVVTPFDPPPVRQDVSEPLARKLRPPIQLSAPPTPPAPTLSRQETFETLLTRRDIEFSRVSNGISRGWDVVLSKPQVISGHHFPSGTLVEYTNDGNIEGAELPEDAAQEIDGVLLTHINFNPQGEVLHYSGVMEDEGEFQGHAFPESTQILLDKDMRLTTAIPEEEMEIQGYTILPGDWLNFNTRGNLVSIKVDQPRKDLVRGDIIMV